MTFTRKRFQLGAVTGTKETRREMTMGIKWRKQREENAWINKKEKCRLIANFVDAVQTEKKSARAQAESGTVGLADSYLTALWLRVKIPAAYLNGGRGGAQRCREGDGADLWRLAWQRWWGQAQKVKGESAAIRKDFEPLTEQPSFRSVRSFPVQMVKKGNLCDSQSSEQNSPGSFGDVVTLYCSS